MCASLDHPGPCRRVSPGPPSPPRRRCRRCVPSTPMPASVRRALPRRCRRAALKTDAGVTRTVAGGLSVAANESHPYAALQQGHHCPAARESNLEFRLTGSRELTDLTARARWKPRSEGGEAKWNGWRPLRRRRRELYASSDIAFLVAQWSCNGHRAPGTASGRLPVRPSGPGLTRIRGRPHVARGVRRAGFLSAGRTSAAASCPVDPVEPAG